MNFWILLEEKKLRDRQQTNSITLKRISGALLSDSRGSTVRKQTSCTGFCHPPCSPCHLLLSHICDSQHPISPLPGQSYDWLPDLLSNFVQNAVTLLWVTALTAELVSHCLTEGERKSKWAVQNEMGLFHAQQEWRIERQRKHGGSEGGSLTEDLPFWGFHKGKRETEPVGYIHTQPQQVFHSSTTFNCTKTCLTAVDRFYSGWQSRGAHSTCFRMSPVCTAMHAKVYSSWHVQSSLQTWCLIKTCCH